MRICVFCGSGEEIGEPYTSAMRNLGLEIARRGHALVFGGYDCGLMGAVAHGVRDGGGLVTGVLSDDVGKATARPVFPCDELLSAKNLTERKTLMKARADAFVAGPGAYGTLDELFEVAAEQKVSPTPVPVAVLNVDGFYDPLAAFDDELVVRGFATPAQADIIHIGNDVAEILDYVES